MQNDNQSRPTTFEIGKEFEQFVKNIIYPKNQYDLISISPENSERYIEANRQPDLKLKRKKSDIPFWVECKYRSNSKTSKITFDLKQIERYAKLGETVTYVIGLGGTPSLPQIVFSIPIAEVFPEMEIWKLERYIINSPMRIYRNSGSWTLKLNETES